MTTVLAVIIAGAKATPPTLDFVVISLFIMAGLAFIIALIGWMPTLLEFSTITDFGLITFFIRQMATLLKFTMISAFITAPIFAYLNYSLIKSRSQKLSPLMNVYAICEIVFLTGFTGLFLLQFFGIIG